VILYDSPVSGNCYKVRLLAAHLGLPLERRPLDVIDRSDRPEVIGDKNPSQRVPTLVLDDGRPLGESGAIIWYLATGTRFAPGDPYEMAQALQWMFFEQYDVEPNIAVARFWLKFAPDPGSHAGALPAKREGGDKALAALERRLTGRDYLVGNRLSVADIALYGYVHVADEGGFDLGRYPAVTAWLARVAAEPGHITIDA
jgi:glutathione S-transferase